jgi:polyphosphate kinase
MRSMTAPPQHFVNRELSLLDFQMRVLGLAERTDLPLLERLKFVAIVTQNLDEFFQVRVAGLMNQVDSGVGTPSPDGLTATQQLAAIDERVTELFSRIDTLFTKELVPLLDEAGIHLIGYDDLEADEIAELQDRFEQQIFPVLTPLAVDPAHPFPYISNLSLNLAVVVRDPDTDQVQFARLKVPPLIPRFAQVGDNRFVPVEQVIAANCHLLFPGHSVVDTFAFRVTRTAELAVEEAEADDLLQAIDSLLRFRQRTAGAIRLEVEEGSREPTVELLRRELQLDPAEVYHRAALLDLSALWSLYDLDRPDLKESPWVPTTSVRLRPAGEEKVRMFDVIRNGDVLVHYPYESFATSTGAFLAQAAKDPKVLAIKQTLYRTWASENPAIGGEEAVVRSLMQAAEAGKQVVVLVELTARFDEAANLTWAKMLEDSGVHVVYGVVGLKTHSKILLVVRRERDGLRRYSHIGTGNYNPKTARIYEDMGIFTADPDIGRDLSELFNALTGYGESSAYRRLLVAPTTLRRRITEQIRREGERGPEGRILFKINHIDDPGIIEALYEASQQGCRIDLIVRGICSLRAGVPGLSPTITVRSIVGRFLEHSRIYRFGHPDNGAVYYLGSADMMTRNLDKRVEALVPVTDPRLKARLEETLQVLLEDDVLAWSLSGETWSKVPIVNGLDTHAAMQRLALDRQEPENSR